MNKTRIPELDGVRGIAIALVFVYHFFYSVGERFPALDFIRDIQKLTDVGWLGVDLFFVLSGYLITGILLETREEPGYYRNFYGRRILRIFPVYYIALTLIFLFSDPQGYHGLGQFVLAHYLYLQNWLFALGAGALPGMLGHFWSLCVEEQFYLVWPWVNFRIRPQTLFKLCLGGFLLLPILRGLILWGLGMDAGQMFVFASTLTRADGLLAGAFLALVVHLRLWEGKHLRWAWGLLTVSGLGALLCLFHRPGVSLWFNPATLSIGFSLIALSGAALVAILLHTPENHPLRRFFRQPWLLFCGKYSYAMYVAHWPLMNLSAEFFKLNGFTSGWSLIALFLLTILLTIAVSLLSWHLVEKNALKLKKYFGGI